LHFSLIYLDEQVDEQAFLHMPDSMIKELIPSVGHRFSFLTNRKIFLESINETSSVANNSIVVRCDVIYKFICFNYYVFCV
jgi:hypothetical protein